MNKNDFREEMQNVLAVKKYLKQTVRSSDSSKQTHKLEVGARQIAEFIGKNVINNTPPNNTPLPKFGNGNFIYKLAVRTSDTKK